MTRAIIPFLAVALIGLPTLEAKAQPYEIGWSTIDGGGGIIQGSSYTLSGSVGQPDASRPLTGPTYTLTGGFWPGIDAEAIGCNAADIAEPLNLLDLADVVAFVQGFQAQDPIADLVAPFGLFDLADLSAFVTAFLTGCP
jgi:hypothetical protein